MKKIIERLKDKLNNEYVILKDYDKNEYYLLLKYRRNYTNTYPYKVEVKGMRNIKTFIINNKLEIITNKCYDKEDKEVKHGKNR